MITRLGHDQAPADNELRQLLNLYRWLNPDDPELNDAEADTLWQQIRRLQHLHYFGLWVGGTLVSSCNMALTANLTRNGRPFALIENVVTHPDHRCQGHGSRILAHAAEVAASLHCYKLMLMTGRNDAVSFYQQAGFDPDRKHAFVRYLD